MDDVCKNLLYWLKHFCRFLLVEKGVGEESVRLFHSAIVNEPETKSRKGRAPSPKTKIQLRAATISKETWQVAVTGKILPGYDDLSSGECEPVPQLSVSDPPAEYAWTRDLPGYEAAKGSAVSAMHLLWAATQAAAAGHNSKTPQLDVFLFQIRAGRIKKEDPRIQEAIRIADKHGFSGNIRERIVQELHNAEKRVAKDFCDFNVSKSFFYDLNWFHMTLAALWVRGLFWLMPDRLIVDFLLRTKAGPPTTRQAVSQAVLQMGLVKHQPPIVKSIENGFQLLFVEGYPPKS
jgi:hypothetical protein